MDISNKLHLEIKAAETLKATIADIAGDDKDLLRDTMEGETRLNNLIEAAAVQIVSDEAMADGVAELVKQLNSRKERIVQRASLLRSACLAAMGIAEIKTIETPAGTLTRKAVPQSAIIIEESVIPSEFWKPQEPKLDKRAVLDALKSGRAVEGAQISNGGETLQIRS
jgi:hypothetical protein